MWAKFKSWVMWVAAGVVGVLTLGFMLKKKTVIDIPDRPVMPKLDIPKRPKETDWTAKREKEMKKFEEKKGAPLSKSEQRRLLVQLEDKYGKKGK